MEEFWLDIFHRKSSPGTPLPLVDLSKGESADRPDLAANAAVVALGNFDGLHIAHQQLIRSAVETAGKMGVQSAVFTFRDTKIDCLTDFGEKLRQIAGLGVDFAAVADFASLRDYPPERFFEEILLDRLKAQAIFCGYNFRFGKNAAGDTETLQKLCDAHSVKLQILPPVTLSGSVVSSTGIRAAIREGDMELAAAMLGRPFTLTGRIAPGRAVGRQNARPTMNIPLREGHVIPKFGVYFTKCTIFGATYPSISNIGVRPTFDGRFGESEILCEVHLLGPCYVLVEPHRMPGNKLELELDHFCRPEQKFDSPEALYEQIARDVDSANQYYELN